MNEIKPSKVLLLGDSLTAAFPYKKINTYDIVNKAVAGDETVDTLRHLSRFDTCSDIQHVCILIGINDVLRSHIGLIDRLPHEVLKNIESIIDNVTERFKKAKHWIQSIYPVNVHEKYVSNNNLIELNSIISKMNDAIYQITKKKSIGYIDVHSKLLQEGVLDKTYTSDGIHINTTGYTRILNALEIRLK